MANQDDFIAIVRKHLNDRIASYTEKLIAADRNGHDLLCGQIRAYQETVKFIESEAKKWRLDDKED
jgi:hypothetical protein